MMLAGTPVVLFEQRKFLRCLFVWVQPSLCTCLQISLHYNIPTPADVTTLSVNVTPEADCSSKSRRPKVSLRLEGL